MPNSRGTLSGGVNHVPNGPMNQPVIPKLPPFNIESASERVLSKKKLDELVRQVTGGEGQDPGESLKPEVEEVFCACSDSQLTS